MKRTLSLVLALILCLSLSLIGQAQESSAVNQTGFPIVDEPITLTCFVAKGVYNTGEFNDLLIWEEYEKMTNIHVDFESYLMGQHSEKFSLKMATNDLPDFFMKVSTSQQNIAQYAREQLFIPITPYLEDYAPNYLAQMDLVSNLRSTVTMSDGEIYGFAYIVTASPAQTRPIFYNKVWFDQLGFDEMPTTTEGLKEVLRAAYAVDYNGNGKADEIPLISNSYTLISHMFRGSFGLGTRGYNNLDVDSEGNLRYVPAAPEYKDLLAFLNELYTEKLLYQEIFDSTLPAVTAAGEQNQVFMGTFNLVSYLGETNKGDYVGVYEPFEGPNGHKLNSYTSNAISNQNTFLTAANEHPEATVRWLDYFYSEEGVQLYFMGIEGVTFEFDADGNPKYNDAMANDPNGLGLEEMIGKFLAWGGGSNPSIAEDRCFGVNMYPELETGITQGLLAYAPETVWGAFSYNEADTLAMTSLQQDIVTYVDEMTAKFITGNASLDQWDTYIDTLNKMGFQELMEIYQRGLDDYNSRVN